MDEAVELDSEEAMKRYIVSENVKLWGATAFDTDDIVIDDKVFSDERIGWNDVHYVCVKRYFQEDYMKLYGCPQCIGHCAADYRK